MENMSNHIYIIPTNRLCVNSLESLLTEIILVEDKYDIEMKVVLIDSSHPKYASENREALLRMAENFKKSQAYFFTPEYLDAICEDTVNNVCPDEKDILLRLLTGRKYSYGMAANRTFLVAALFDCDYLHRRDSDTFIQHLDDGRILSPLEIELKFLGRNILTLKDLVDDSYLFSSDETVYMVGGGYKGNWAIDYEDLVEDIDSLNKLIHLAKPSMSCDEIKDYVNRKYINGCKEKYENDILSFSLSKFIDVGNFSLYKIYNFLPVSPAVETSGTDYFFHGILEQLGKPKLYHNRRVIHKYDSDRYDDNSLNSYHLSKAKARCLALYDNLLFEEIRKNKELYFKGGTFFTQEIASYLIKLAEKDLIREQENILDLMISSYKDTKMEKYIKLAEYINSNKSSIVCKTSEDVHAHGVLISKWTKIIEYVKSNKKNLLECYCNLLEC